MVARQALLVCALVLLLRGSSALYEDQAGSYDWYKPYLGPIATAAFHKTKPRVYIASEQGVVGALNLKDGSIAFRHQPAGASTAQSQLVEGSAAAFVTAVGSVVHAWDHSDGSLKWSAELPGKRVAAHQPVLRVTKGSEAVVAVLGAGMLTTYEAASGEKAGSVKLSDAARQAPVALLDTSRPDSITGYALAPGSKTIHVITLSGETQAEAPVPLSTVAAAGPAGLLAVSQDHSQACALGTSEDSSVVCASLKSLLGVAKGDARLQAVATATGWAIAMGDPDQPGAALISLQGGAVKTVASYKTASAVSAPFAATAGEVMAVVTVEEAGTVSIEYVLAETGAVVSKEGPIKGARSDRLAPGTAAPGVRTAVVGAYKKRDQSEGYRSLLVWQDERISFVQQGVSVWTRDEALGGVTTALFSDLPPGKKAAAGVESQIGGGAQAAPRWQDELSEFAHQQLLNAKVQFKLASADEVAELHRVRSVMSDKTAPTRDTRGFRRSLIVATASGKIAALHNGDGRVLWSRPGPLGRRVGKQAAPQHLVAWRSYHDLEHAPQVATLARSGAKGTFLSVLDVYTGRETEAVTLDHAADKLIRIGHVSDGQTADQEVYLAVSVGTPGDAPTVHLLPDTPLTREYFLSQYRSIYFFLDGAAAGPDAAFRGFGFDAAAAESVRASGQAKAVSAWSLSFPAPVLSWSAIDPQEPVHTSVRVLGDRSMKYRYLNTNTMVVVTGLQPGAPQGEKEDTETPATIYVVDTATGAVRHAQTAPMCRGPAVIAFTENMAAVQLWDAGAGRFSVTSLELFDGSERSFNVLDHLFNPNATAPQSSWDPPPLEVLTLSFFTRTPARSFLTTRTRAGITSKMLVQLTDTDQVYAVDMRFLDPRRPMNSKLTPEQAEERLIPYFDTLPLMPPMFASYNKQIMGLKAAISAPSRLESTSLLFSYGVDLQYTRLAPAKNFDSLDDDFSYGLLIVALISLAAGSAFMHVYTKKSILQQHWL